MPTNAQIKANVDEFIIDPTSPQSVTRANVGNIIKSTVDYTDQEVDTLRTELTNDIAEQIAGVWQPAGSWDASVGTFPTTGTGVANAVEAGDVYRVSGAGTLGGVPYSIGDSFYALINNPGQTAANWDRFNYNVEAATTEAFGTVKIASDADVEAGTGDGMVSSTQLGDKFESYTPNLGYKEYVAHIVQSGTSAPTVTVIRNNTGVTPVFGAPSGGSPGRYPISIPSFNQAKTEIHLSPRTAPAKRLTWDYSYTSGTTVSLRTYNEANSAYENDMLPGNILRIIIED